MEKKIAVHVPNQWLSEAVQKHLRDVHGKKINNIIHMSNLENAHISLYSTCGEWASTGTFYRNMGYEIITVDEYFKRFSKPPEPPIMIDGEEVVLVADKNRDGEITWSGIKVGCVSVSWDKIKQIWDCRPDEYK